MNPTPGLRWLGLALGAVVALVAGCGARGAEEADSADTPYEQQMHQWRVMDAAAPVVQGVGHSSAASARIIRGRSLDAQATTAAVAANAVPVGGADAAVNGVYGATVTWPIIPIHMALMPDGRVVSYGSDSSGVQGAQLYYDIWDPTLGTDATAHMLLPNTTQTDIFCSGMSVMWTTGDLVIAGGDERAIGKPGLSINQTALFDGPSNTLSTTASMNLPRWYGTLIALPSGRMLVLGGRQSSARNVDIPAITPEVFDSATGWTLLPGAASAQAFGSSGNSKNWFYPRAYVAPSGQLLVLDNTGLTYWLDPTAGGNLTLVGKLPPSYPALPAVMYAPGKVLALRGTNRYNTAVTIDINGPTPVVTSIAPTSQKRWWSNATVMADGRVLVNGGAAIPNQLIGIAYRNEIWDPATGLFTLGAAAAQPRLYHSNALLLPDGSVLTGGGGAPGPIKNLNAEIFYPPYLYANDGSGQPAPRPTVQTDGLPVSAGQQIAATVTSGDQIVRVTMVRMGAATHAVNIDQRFMDVPFGQVGQALTVAMPVNPNVLLPGTYMMFSFNAAGTPSVANLVRVVLPSSPGAPPPPVAARAPRQAAARAAAVLVP